MPINYTIQSNIANVTTNTVWANQDIPPPGSSTGDGQVDSGNMPLSLTLTPNEGYTLSAADLKISGQEATSSQNESPYPGATWTYSVRTFDPSVNPNIELPGGVELVKMYDNTNILGNAFGDQFVTVLAFLETSYPLMYQDIVIVLDIDGDAVEIPIDYTTLNPGSNAFNIILELDEDSNCLAVPVQPNTTWLGNNDNFSYSFPQDEYSHIGVMTLTRNSGVPENTILNSASLNSLPWVGFFILPKPGYHVSKSNFQPDFSSSFQLHP